MFISIIKIERNKVHDIEFNSQIQSISVCLQVYEQ